MPPSKHNPKRPKRAAGAGGRVEAAEEDAPPLEKPEKNRHIALNLLARQSIATTNARLPFKAWPSWQCTHCGRDFTPGMNSVRVVCMWDGVESWHTHIADICLRIISHCLSKFLLELMEIGRARIFESRPLSPSATM